MVDGIPVEHNRGCIREGYRAFRLKIEAIALDIEKLKCDVMLLNG